MANLLTHRHLRAVMSLVAGIALMAPGAAPVAAAPAAMPMPASAVPVDPGPPVATDPAIEPGGAGADQGGAPTSSFADPGTAQA
jgi:hypothetical protein